MDAAELVEENERETLLAIGGLDVCTLSYVPGATLLDSGVDLPTFNGVIATACTGPDVPAVYDAADAWFGERGRPWVWRAGPGNAPADLPARLEALGFSLEDDDEEGMVCSLSRGMPGPAHDDIGEAAGDHALDEWFSVFSEAFAIPPQLHESLEPVVRAAATEGPFRNFIARVDGDAVACGTLTLGAGAAGVANIGVRPEYRGEGLGRAMTQALMAAAAEAGQATAVLSAAGTARDLYRRLGFTETGRRRIYVPPV